MKTLALTLLWILVVPTNISFHHILSYLWLCLKRFNKLKTKTQISLQLHIQPITL